MKVFLFLRKSILVFAILLYLFVFLSILASYVNSSYNDTIVIVFYISIIIISILFVFITVRINLKNIYIYLCLAILPILFQLIFSYNVFLPGDGDLKFNYLNATNIANNNFKYPSLYCATFPGTITYPTIIAIFFKFLGIRRMVPVLLNHLTITLAICSMFSFLKKIMPTSYSLSACMLIAIHPFVIIYAATCNAEMIFGSLILISLWSFERYSVSVSIHSKLFWITITSLICGISTLFRPLAIIMILSIILYVLFFQVDNIIHKLYALSTLIAVFLLFSIINNIIVKYVSTYDAPSSSYGWNLYVGASKTGKWNESDANEFSESINSASSTSEIQEYFAQKAFDRYNKMGWGVIQHSIDKLYTWNSSEYIVDQIRLQNSWSKIQLKDSIYFISTLIKIVDTPIFILALISCFTLLFASFKNKYSPLLILVFYLIGSFIVLLFLEIAFRYTVSYRMVFCLLAVHLVYSLKENKTK